MEEGGLMDHDELVAWLHDREGRAYIQGWTFGKRANAIADALEAALHSKGSSLRAAYFNDTMRLVGTEAKANGKARAAFAKRLGGTDA
jgi:hypothetical protein